jgi:organic radical activating enzyme
MDDRILVNGLGTFTHFKCNLSCHGCCNFSDHHKLYSEPFNDWRRDYELFGKRFRTSGYSINGGEPLTHPDIRSMIEGGYAFSSRVKLTTNGLLLKDNMWLWDIMHERKSNFGIKISYHQTPELSGKTKYDQLLATSISEFFSESKIKYSVDDILAKIEDHSLNKPKIHLFLHNNLFIVFTHQYWLVPQLDEVDLPVPYNSDPVNAYHNGCSCQIVHLYNGKLYKCSMTPVLPIALEKYDRYDDKWQDLKNYQPYDLSLPHDPQRFKALTMPEQVCSICPESRSKYTTKKSDKYSKIINIRVK